MSLNRARAEALDILDKIKRGQDPRVESRRRKEAATEEAENTFGRIAMRFIAEYAKGKKRPLRTRTVKGYEWALTGEPTTTWILKPLVSVSDRDIIKAVDRFEARKQFASARLLRAYLHRFFKWALEKRLVDKNPAANVALASTPSDFKRDRVLSLPELRYVTEMANQLDNPARAFLHILILCGQRRGETSLMKWNDLQLDGDKPLWNIPAENAKNRRAHDVPLSPEVVMILKKVPRMGAQATIPADEKASPKSEFVFTTDGETPISGFSKIKAKLDSEIEADRKAKRLEDRTMAHWTTHDLRRSAATGMANLGIAPHIIEEILNHISGAKAGVAGIYNRSKYDEERRRALEAWAKLVTLPRAMSDDVVIPRAKTASSSGTE